jgi:hypothetical protein
MKTHNLAAVVFSWALIVMMINPATVKAEPIVMNFGLAAPDWNPSFWPM